MEKLAIIGAGDLGQLMAFYAINEGTYSFVGFYDDLYKTGERKGIGQILGPIDNIEKQFESNIFDRIIIGIGYKHLQFRENLFNNLIKSIPFASIIHNSLITTQDAIIGKGVFILPGCQLDRGVRIGNNTVLNVSLRPDTSFKISSLGVKILRNFNL